MFMYTADAADMEVKVPLKTYIKFGGFRFPQIKTSLTSKVGFATWSSSSCRPAGRSSTDTCCTAAIDRLLSPIGGGMRVVWHEVILAAALITFTFLPRSFGSHVWTTKPQILGFRLS